MSEETSETFSWVRIPLPSFLKQLRKCFPDIQGEAYAETQRCSSTRQTVIDSVCSGSVYRSNPLLFEGKRLALAFFFDFAVTTMNSLGRSGAHGRNWGVFSVAVMNVPSLRGTSKFVFPLSLIDKDSFSAVGYDRFIAPYISELREVQDGASFSS